MVTLHRWNGWLEPAQLERLKAVAAQEKSSVARIVRLAIDAYLPAAKGKRS